MTKEAVKQELLRMIKETRNPLYMPLFVSGAKTCSAYIGNELVPIEVYEEACREMAVETT